MRRLYSLLFTLAAPLLLVRLAWKGVANPDYRARRRERFGHVPPTVRPGGVWVHAVSVGEVLAAVPLVERLLAADPERPVLVTTMTPTGSDQVRRRFGSRVDHCYVPYDLPGAVRRFMTRVAPRAAIIMETELWPNLFHACAGHGIPLILANARLSAKSAAGYRRFSGLAACTLGCVTAVAAQGEADGRRFVELGVPDARVRVTGSVKFDFTVPDTLPQAAAALRTRCGDRPVWIAGSTHAGEEAQVLEAHGAIRRRFADALLILVPRHPERFGEVARLAGRLGLTVARRSLGESPAAAAVYLGDTMGELLQLYATADVAFVGGSLVPVGGHNLIEPAALGRPVVTGPHLHNFARIAELLDTAGALLTVDSSEALAEGVVALFDDADRRAVAGSAGQEVVARNRGALDRLEALVAEALEGGRAVAA